MFNPGELTFRQWVTVLGAGVRNKVAQIIPDDLKMLHYLILYLLIR